MSRRPAAQGADAAERNRATLKQLVKLESNKSCADCKRNKHPRWASWNLGIFVCIRCSGIHRSLGVHISRVKSVDLDSWTDEQMASMLKWGNKRANRYWEHKLAEGHVPNESKIENFIRTKYDSKRWVMDGPMPDPSTLDEAGDDDDNVPLKVVQERARDNSGRNGSAPAAAPPVQVRARPQDVDLFGDSVSSTPPRPSTTEPAAARPGPPKASAAPPRQTRPGESLLGLDFLGGTSSAPPARPSSTGPGSSATPGRTDLKQSILSLYASKPAPPPQQASSNAGMFGGMQSPPHTSPTPSNVQALGGLGDAFGSLSFASPQQAQPRPAPFSGLVSPTGHSRQGSIAKQNPLSGGNFFDSKPAAASVQNSARKESFGNDFGDFSSAVTSPGPTTSSIKSSAAASSSIGDLFSMASPAPTLPPKPAVAPAPPAAKQPPPIQASSYYNSTAFNLSQPTQAAASKPAPPQTSTISNVAGLSNLDAWGSNDAWATSDPAPAPALPAQPPPQTQTSALKPAAPAAAPVIKMESPFDSGWGDPEPAPAKPATVSAISNTTGLSSPSTGFGQSASGFNVQQDEEFGGWSHASPVAATSGPKQGGLGGNQDDLFGNVWG
ncbi:stromal membrane-associated protein 2-like [Teratosphaeria destructans]|uniref:Stromal membrane-associated protein 2-like n=1 Tax=Teratosphaeria destructans TaxID=418781 RepID=A0A9W7W4N7_9PEZI|nr:stromal membrane-associated protein 2-like [Teratosphaeria destructans]